MTGQCKECCETGHSEDCKMTVKKHRCTNCKKYFDADSMIIVTAGKFHNQECLIEYGMKKTVSVIKKAKAHKKKVGAEQKKKFNFNDLRKQKKLTQTAFNKMRKLQELKWFKDRGLEPECISCGKKDMDWCCGHFKTVGSQGWLRYDEKNTYLQCNRYCNKALSGNINGNKSTRGYLEGLKERFGETRSLQIINYCETDRTKTWCCEELNEMRKGFNSASRYLSKQLGEYSGSKYQEPTNRTPDKPPSMIPGRHYEEE